MSGTLTHSPADIIARLLVDLGLGSEGGAGGDWPVHVASEPDSPDQTLTLYDTASVDQGRTMTDGRRQERHGFQVRIRSALHTTGYAKARAVAVALDEQVYQETVVVGGQAYLVHAVSRSSGVIALGREKPESRRELFTVNGTVVLKQL